MKLSAPAKLSYTYGDDLISQSNNGQTSYYHYDGLGSTRQLSNAAGTITDSYDYQAFGKLLNQTGNTANNYLFTGEQFDKNLDQYYLRARYYNQNVGRFTQQDTYAGSGSDPITLHKYLYANADGVNNIDPSGNMTLAGAMQGISISFSMRGAALGAIRLGSKVAGVGVAGLGINAQLEYLLGFPLATMKAQNEINREAMYLAATNVKVNSGEKPIGHHSIPVYMCGAAEASRQQLVPLKPSVHVPLHSAMVTYSAAINSAYKNVFTGTNKIFSYSNKEPLQLLAETPQGRAVISKHLDLFYSFGWYELGAPYFRGIFEQEQVKYIGGVTSLPSCQKP
ncbi:MAG: RHS repeat-associated core domain-containing protein [Marinagarivorans sp.]|nr:RHS repeat-associated core domain-containing protein [Marinagarivorans sp.]